ncbi:MAG TPA: serine hydrolase, partial [Longimicrobiaceae bacterium]|nr:serine hydrolase [Longimicrobiaceae bacterium]
KVAQMVVAREDAGMLEGGGSPELRRWVSVDSIGGVVVTGGAAGAVAAMLDTLGRHSALPLLAAAEMDRGAGTSIAGATELAPGAATGAAGDADAAAASGTVAAAEAKALGIRLALLSGPPMNPDAFASPFDAASSGAAEGTVAFAEALRRGGMLAAVRAFPAPSGTDRDSLAVLSWDRAALEAGPAGFVQRLDSAGVDGLMLGPVALPSATGDTVPFPVNAVAMFGLLRRDLGFGGLVLADVDTARYLSRTYGGREAAVRAVAAGADVLVGVADPRATIDAVMGGVRSGRIPASRVEAAVRRIFAAKERAGLGIPPAAADTVRGVRALASADAVSAARAGFEASTMVLGSAPSVALKGCRKVAVAAAAGMDVRTLAAQLRPLGAVFPVLADTVALRGPLTDEGDSPANDADCLVAVRFPGAAPVLVDRVVELLTPAAAAQAAAAASTDTSAVRSAPADSAAAAAAMGRDTVPRRIVDVAFATTEPPAGYAPASYVLAWGTRAEAQTVAARAITGAWKPAHPPPASVAWPASPALAVADPRSAGMNPEGLAKIDAAIAQGIRDGVFPGAAIAVGRHGALVKLRGYGALGDDPASPGVSGSNTIYDLASLTKVAGTTAAVMALVDDGKIKLDVSVHHYLPDFKGGSKGGVTVRNLLTHTAGLPEGEDLYNDRSSPQGALREVYADPLKYEPGTKMLYSDFSMILMKEIVERTAGEPIDRFLARRVWGPLGMTSTMYRPPLVFAPRTAPGALRSERPYVVRGVVHDGNAFRLGGVAGHAGLFSTARDLAVYAQTLLNGGTYGARRIYSRAVVTRFTTPQGLPGNRGLGWDIPGPKSSAGAYFSARAYGHTGFTGTSIWIDPDKDLFVVLLTNRTYDKGTSAGILSVRAKVHDAAALAITDVKVGARAGAVVPQKPKLKARPRAKPSRASRGRSSRTTRATTHRTTRRTPPKKPRRRG